MKRVKYLFVILLALILVECRKSNEPNIPYFDFTIYWKGHQEQGSAEADVFDKKWKASAYIFPHPTELEYFSLIYETYTPDGILREQILMGSISKKFGKYKVISDFSNDILDDGNVNGNYSTFTDDGDVLNGGYETDDQYDNELYIDDVDTINHIMHGRFKLMFDLNEDDYSKNLARKVLFENGTFEVKI